jgi:hypothetical protein
MLGGWPERPALGLGVDGGGVGGGQFGQGAVDCGPGDGSALAARPGAALSAPPGEGQIVGDPDAAAGD